MRRDASVDADSRLHLLSRPGGPVAMTSSADVRLVWAPSQSGSAPSGAWWPRSRDATLELRTLLPLVGDHLGGSVTRVSLNIDAWDADQPRRLRIDDHVVRLGWFHTLDPATVTLARGSDARVTLHVVAPGLDPAEGRELLRELSATHQDGGLAAARRSVSLPNKPRAL